MNLMLISSQGFTYRPSKSTDGGWTVSKSLIKSIGRGNAYARKIFPAMKKILTQTCLAAQETAEPRKRRYVRTVKTARGILI